MNNDIDYMLSYRRRTDSDYFPEDKMLAQLLHENFCTKHKTCNCKWCHEDSWEEDEHKHYLEKARKALKVTDYSTAIKLSSILKN